MASIELSTLTHHFGPDEIAALESALAEAGSSPLDIDDDAETILLERDVDDDMLADVLDRLDVNEAACDVYVPPDFEGVFEIAGTKVGSAHALILALREVAEDLGIDEDEDDEPGGDFDDDEDGDTNYDEDGGADFDEPSYDLRDESLRRVCKLLLAGAQHCVRKGVAMFVNS